MKLCFSLGFIILSVLEMSLCQPLLRYNSLNSDAVFFPDQLDYLRVWNSQCNDKGQVYWPWNGRCYEERAQGPCLGDEMVVFDKKKLKPRCLRKAPASKARPTTTPAAPITTTLTSDLE